MLCLTIKINLTGTAMCEFEFSVQRITFFKIFKYCASQVPASYFCRSLCLKSGTANARFRSRAFKINLFRINREPAISTDSFACGGKTPPQTKLAPESRVLLLQIVIERL